MPPEAVALAPPSVAAPGFGWPVSVTVGPSNCASIEPFARLPRESSTATLSGLPGVSGTLETKLNGAATGLNVRLLAGCAYHASEQAPSRVLVGWLPEDRLRSSLAGSWKSLDGLASTNHAPVAVEQAGVEAVNVTTIVLPGFSPTFRSWMQGPVTVPNVHVPRAAVPWEEVSAVTPEKTDVGKNRFAEPS